MKTSRAEVYAAIDSEREYQVSRWGLSGESHSNLEYLVYIRDYVEEAMHRLSRTSDAAAQDATRDSLRKIAALAVVAQERNGALKRAQKGGAE